MSEEGLQPQGLVLDGRYRIIRRIAEGGMATVYEALDERLSRQVAVKIMHLQLAQGPHRAQFVERFYREVRSAASIASPHIVQVYDSGEYQGRNYLVMEYVRGVNLRYEMNMQGTFSVHETLRIISETLEGLSAAHETGVVHRDIKPENILLNTRGHVQITDFGLAKAASQATLSTTGMLLGTAAYLAPEMIELNQATKQGDLYALGIIAYEMLSGSVPFASDNPVTLAFRHVHDDVPRLDTVCDGIDPSVSAVIGHLCERAMESRPKDAYEALQEINACNARLSPDAGLFRVPPSDRPQSENTEATALQARHQETASMAVPVPPAAGQAEHTQQTSTSGQTVDSGQGMDSDQTVNLGAWGAHDGEGDTQIRHESAMGAPTAQTPRKRRRPALIAAISVFAVLLLSGGIFSWWYFLGPGSYWTVPQPNDITCTNESVCNLAGADFSKYESTLKVSGIAYSVSKEYSDSVANGRIISASPEAVGSHVSKRGGSLKIVVSQGMKQSTIPEDILDATSEAGKKPLEALKNAGFSAVSHDEDKDEYSLTVPEGAAISVSPEPGTTLDHNASVSIVLSKGPKPVSMPDITGKSKASAEQQLAEAQLKVTYTEDWSDSVESGKVVSATQQAGAQLHWGDAVTVVISKGPQMVTMPDVRGQSSDDASKTLKALGFEVKISAPLGDLTHTVRLQSPDPGASVRLRDSNGKATVVTLTVV
ncbi:MAG: PASTA domain-containing protein [Bifidobacterium psychraerophilum]|uniref:Stk1 family PASTA domain-containing Ser/Thr kinase n=1 Tax=Bifidobacterium psychraerophilum TaxID=218140 RepID=UPI0039E9C7C9